MVCIAVHALYILDGVLLVWFSCRERAAVNLDGFESATKGRNVKLGSTLAISLPIPVAFSTPVPLPFSRPFSRVKLVSEHGTWLNKLLRSPTAPRPQMVKSFLLSLMV